MRITILDMLSTNSLQAFSSASTTAPINRATPANPVRLIRAQPEPSGRQPGSATSPLPDIRPGIPPARGSLLNLSV